MKSRIVGSDCGKSYNRLDNYQRHARKCVGKDICEGEKTTGTVDAFGQCEVSDAEMIELMENFENTLNKTLTTMQYSAIDDNVLVDQPSDVKMIDFQEMMMIDELYDEMDLSEIVMDDEIMNIPVEDLFQDAVMVSMEEYLVDFLDMPMEFDI